MSDTARADADPVMAPPSTEGDGVHPAGETAPTAGETAGALPSAVGPTPSAAPSSAAAADASGDNDWFSASKAGPFMHPKGFSGLQGAASAKTQEPAANAVQAQER